MLLDFRPTVNLLDTTRATLFRRGLLVLSAAVVSCSAPRGSDTLTYYETYDPRSLEPDGPSGVLHAKAVVADDEAVLVTSANLTEAALDRNIEIGLLVRDRALAASMTMHFRVLIDRGFLSLLPSR